MDPSETTDDESTLERPNSPPHPEAERVRSVYREVWDEFFDEARKHSRAHIDALCRRPLRAEHDTLLEDEILQHWHTATEVERAHASEFQDMIMEDKEGPTEKYVTVRTERYPAVQEHPGYEACAPVIRNMSFREGDPASDRDLKLHFAPYADLDNPKFDCKTYFDESRYVLLAWEWDLDDNPDVEAIKGETVRRLHFGHGLGLEVIDATKVLTGSTPLRKSNEDGLLWYHAQREPIPWFRNPAHDYPQLPTTTYKPSHPKELYVNSASVFCANLNCVMAMCPTHPTPNRPRHFPKPTKTATGLRCMVTEPCGKHCISIVTDRDRESVPPRDWTESDTKDLETILMIEPDALPCYLAVLCRKTCWEAYEERCRLLPDTELAPTQPEEQPKPNFTYRDTDRKRLLDTIPPGPCQHEGPCSSLKVCSCWQAKFHCTRECYCASTCQLKWKGCACDGPCGDTCACKEAGRECELDVCRCPKIHSGDGQGRFCNNMDIQLGRSVRLEVKVGTFGLGAFAMEDVRKGTYIGEYVGELGRDLHNLAREHIRKYIGLNYLFELNKAARIRSVNSDSARVGNETRYINHPVSVGGENVSAKQYLVNGDFRMGIWSVKGIPKGEELFLNYGKEYFKYFREQEQGMYAPAQVKVQKRRRKRKNW